MNQGGDTTFGRYRLLERLGQGGMAEVFKAKSYGVEGFEKVVVIKRILPELAASETFVDMFIHEAKLAVRLSHANVVQVFDLGLAPAREGEDARDAYYMAMEYVSGFDLATVLARCRKQQLHVPIEMAVYVAAEVAKGLDHAHRRRDEQGQPLNIVHLDVSPQNVLLSLEGEVKVTDFGIAKARGALDRSGDALEDTQTRQLQGKFAYMSPEHATGEVVDARADLFSLGTVLYEMLTGVNPFSGPTSFETLRRVTAVEVPPVLLLRPDVPKELVAILATAMAKAPADRFADAGRMYEALLAFLYAQGRRFSAHDLAAFLQTFRAVEEPADVVLDADVAAAERTPVEIPLTRAKPGSQPPSNRPSLPAAAIDVERAAGMGEHREVTVLAIELPGRDDREAEARAADTVARYGGRVLAREPEQVVALFGEGLPDGRDTEVATRCALVCLRTLAGDREAGAGLHVGRVHVASDGRATDDARLAALVGTARELSRVEEGACAVSGAAVRQVQSLFVVDAHKDRATGVTSTSAYVVREVRAPSEAFGRFVGRKDELHAVGEMLASATRRVASVLTVRGDHGVGKTRLLLEVERRLKKGGYNVGWYFATCVPRGTELPLSGIQAMLQTLCGIAEGDPEHRIRQVAPRLRALGLQDDEVSAVLSALGAAHAGAASASPQKGSLTAAFMRMVQRLCEDRPHAFAWDAAHGMDDESFGVLRATLEKLPQTRVLFVLTTRAGFAHPLEKLSVHAGLDLADLDPDDAERLVAQRLGITRVPPELTKFVRDRAGGHPQMIEEVLKALLESRAITVADGAVVTIKLTQQELALPKTLRGLVASRVARLDAKDRAILQAAAVLGDPVNVGVLATMTGVAAGALERTVATLEERSFVVHTSAVELRFTSPIVREVVTFALTPEVAREMHAAAGLALSNEESHASEHASRIATHLYEAGDRERAGVYFAASAERRMEAGQLEAAARDWARAFDLVDLTKHETRAVVTWFARLADAVDSVRALGEPLEVCERVIARVDAGPFSKGHELDDRVKVRIDAGRILGAVHLLDAARTQLVAAEAIAQGKPALVASALVASSHLASRQGDFKRALGFLERLDELASKTGGAPGQEHTLRLSLAQTCAAMDDRPAALRHLGRAEAVLPTDARAACERHKTRAIVEYFARDYAAAAASFERAVDAARDLGLSHEVSANLHNLGDVLVRQGDHARAYGALKQSLALATDNGYARIASHDRMFLAYLDARAGDTDAATRLLAGIRYAEAHDFTLDVLGGRLLYAELLAHRGEEDAARAEYQKLRELARAAGNRLVEGDCVTALSRMGAAPSQAPPPLPGPGGLAL